MQLTITSEDPLDRVVDAVSGMFGVTLTVATGRNSSASGEQSAQRSQGSASQRRATPGQRRRSVGMGPSSADIRRWAQDNGYDVSPRGRIPAKVAMAYREAH